MGEESKQTEGDVFQGNFLEFIDQEATELEQAQNEESGMTYRMAMRLWGGDLPAMPKFKAPVKQPVITRPVITSNQIAPDVNAAWKFNSTPNPGSA